MSLFIGLMTGTSVDGIDVAIVDFSDGARLVFGRSYPVENELRTGLLECARNNNLHETLTLDVRLGEALAEAVRGSLAECELTAADITAIGSHGQTVFHAPNEDSAFTCQIGDPNIIAARTGIKTVADFRRRDVAAGGQGAPLAPAFHEAMLRSSAIDRAVLNIGGIANLTLLPSNQQLPTVGFDTGPGNGLMDAWITRHLDQPMDFGAAWALQGICNRPLLAHLKSDEYFKQTPPKSTGKEFFDLAWLDNYLAAAPEIEPQDVQRTLAELTAETVSDALALYAPSVAELLVCGGGVHNPLLMQSLQDKLPTTTVQSTDERGIDPDFLEAMAFAWLAKRTLQGQPGNLPSVTGADSRVVLGAIYNA